MMTLNEISDESLTSCLCKNLLHIKVESLDRCIFQKVIVHDNAHEKNSFRIPLKSCDLINCICPCVFSSFWYCISCTWYYGLVGSIYLVNTYIYHKFEIYDEKCMLIGLNQLTHMSNYL